MIPTSEIDISRGPNPGVWTLQKTNPIEKN